MSLESRIDSKELIASKETNRRLKNAIAQIPGWRLSGFALQVLKVGLARPASQGLDVKVDVLAPLGW